MGGIFKSKIVLLFLSFFIPIFLLTSCDNTVSDGTWAKLYRTANEEYSMSIQKTKDGGIVVLGMTYSGPFYIFKIDDKGTIQWQKKMTEYPYIIMLQETGGGDFIAGGFEFVDYNFSGFYLTKISKNGAAIWKKVYNTPYRPTSFAMCVDPSDDSIVVAGNSYKGYNNNSVLEDIMVLKVDSTGALLWQEILHTGSVLSNGNMQGAITKTPDGGYLLSLQDNRSVRPRIGLMKINREGSPLWTKTYGGFEGSQGDPDRMYDYFCAIEPTSDGGIIASGVTDWNEPLRRSGELPQVWVLKFDGTGNIQWGKGLDGLYEIISPSDMLVSPVCQYYWMGIQPISIRQLNDGGYALLVDSSSYAEYKSLGYNYDDYTKRMGFLLRLSGQGDIVWQKDYRDKTKTFTGFYPNPGDEGQIIGDEGGLYTSIQDSISVGSFTVLQNGGFMIAGSMDSGKSTDIDMIVMKTDDQGDISNTRLKIQEGGATIRENFQGFLPGQMDFTAEYITVTAADSVPGLSDVVFTVTKN
jgi:hypothetical protein